MFHATTVIICTVGMTLPFAWGSSAFRLGFKPLPWLYWPLVTALLVT